MDERGFEASYRVRFDEAGADGHLRASGLARYAQDIAWRHSEAVGFDRHWYSSRGTLWLVRCLSLRIHAAVGYGESLQVTTEVAGWHRVWARRTTTFRSVDGSVVADADTDWVLLTREGHPVRVPDEIVGRFAPDRSFRPQRVVLPAEPPDAAVVRYLVRDSDLDPLGHVNNAAWVDLVDDSARASMPPGPSRRYRLEYLRPAGVGADLKLISWADDRQLSCRVRDEQREVLRAVVEGATISAG